MLHELLISTTYIEEALGKNWIDKYQFNKQFMSTPVEEITIKKIITRYNSFFISPSKKQTTVIIRGYQNVLNKLVLSLQEKGIYVISVLIDQYSYSTFLFNRFEILNDNEINNISEFKVKLLDLQVASKYHQLIASARSRNLDFNLTLFDIKKLLTRKTCFYSKVKLTEDPQSKYRRTIDRIDCTKGYVKGNVVACTSEMNSLKEQLFEHKIIDLNGIENIIKTLKGI